MTKILSPSLSARPAPTALGRLLQTSLGARAFEIIAVFGVAGAVLICGRDLGGDDPVTSQAPVLLANAFMLLVIWQGARLRGEGLAHLGLQRRPTQENARRPSRLRVLGQALLSLLFAGSAFIVAAILMANLIGVPEPADMSAYNPFAGNLRLLLLSLPFVWFFSAFGEELIYRGFLIGRLTELSPRIGPSVAVCLSALTFGLAHYTWGPAGVVQTAFMGLALGIAYLRVGRNLWVTILAHGIMDTVLFVQMYSQSPVSPP